MDFYKNQAFAALFKLIHDLREPRPTPDRALASCSCQIKTEVPFAENMGSRFVDHRQIEAPNAAEIDHVVEFDCSRPILATLAASS
ncbi:hypothetical protein CU048_05970 [Beijerinckiaceae bacterium]|nr:hypothetical protein CU048_05970 [Beijerinckiaceae bacterium]